MSAFAFVTLALFQVAGACAGEVARGEYLAIAGNCASCHTAHQGELMAGGLAFDTPFGTIYSTNITPDSLTGIGDWSLEQFQRAMRHGVGANGEQLYPVFPYTAFTKVTDADNAALFAYLKSLEPVARTNADNDLRFPFNFRPLLAIWKTLFFEAGQFEPQPNQSAEWNRGAYLVEALAHCGACHSPRNFLGAEQYAQAYAGGEYIDRVPGGQLQPWSAPNLTQSQRGLGRWSHADLAEYLKSARNDFVESFGPMNEVIINSTQHLHQEDVAAMTSYLMSVPAQDPGPAPAPETQVMGFGRTVYNLHCGTCHLPTGEGDPEMGPKLNGGSLVVQAENPASMINVILYGPEAPNTSSSSPWREPMRDFQYLLDDDEIAAVATYIRNSWSNSAGSVTIDQVERQR